MKGSRNPDSTSEFEFEGSQETRRTSIPVREFAKRLLNTGVDAVHLTEDSLRQLVGDVNPREAVSGLFEGLSKGTDTLQTVLVREARRYLDAINLHDELGRLLNNYTIEVNARINFEPREKSRAGKKGRVSKSRDKEARVETEVFKFKLVPKDGGDGEESG